MPNGMKSAPLWMRPDADCLRQSASGVLSDCKVYGRKAFYINFQ